MKGAPSGFFEDWEADRAENVLAAECLHTSGSGITCLYRSRSGGRNRLYKVLAPRFRGNLLYESILRKEFEIGYSLTHPGICSYYAFQHIEGLGNAIELEWIEGCTLREWLERKPSRKEKGAVLDALLDAVAYMHRKQVVHRDLKPENVMITDSGNHVKIIDFGFSDSDAHAINKGAAGTRGYAAPELLEGLPADQRADIWSLGKMIEEMLPSYAAVASRCLARDPQQRYQSVEQLQEALRRRRRLWLLPVAAALVLATVAAYHLRTYSDADVDALVREAEESISAIISSAE